MMQSTTKNNLKHSFKFLLLILIIQKIVGSTAFPIAKFGLAHIDPFTFAFFRFLLSSLILLTIVKFKKYAVPIEKKDLLKIAGLGVMVIIGNQTMFLYGQKYTAVGHAALLFATVPIWIFLGAIVFLKEKFVMRRVIGIIVALVGVFVIMSGGVKQFGMQFLFGDLIILISVLTWALYTVLSKPLAQKYGALRFTAYAISFGSLAYFPFGIYQASIQDYSQIPFESWLSVIYMSVMISGISYVTWLWILKYLEASRIAVYHNMQPILASTIAFFWLGEPLGMMFIIGGLIAIGGVIIAES